MRTIILSVSTILLLTGCVEKTNMENIKQVETKEDKSILFSPKLKRELQKIDSTLASELNQMEFYIHRYKILSKSCISMEEEYKLEKNISEDEKQLWEAEIDDCYKDSREGTIDLISMGKFSYRLENLKDEEELDGKKYDYIKDKLEKIEDWIKENSKKYFIKRR